MDFYVTEMSTEAIPISTSSYFFYQTETQTYNNKNLNSLIWTFAFFSKHLHSGEITSEIATYLAICIFNKGFKSILNMIIFT